MSSINHQKIERTFNPSQIDIDNKAIVLGELAHRRINEISYVGFTTFQAVEINGKTKIKVTVEILDEE